MFINEHTAISTPSVLLVPYIKHHVPQYHKWMEDPAIQEATASEPLTIAQEYAMQASWRKDADKLTFIICQPLPTPADQKVLSHIRPEIHDTASQMIGDVNLFLSLSTTNADINPDPDAKKSDADAHANRPNANEDADVTGELEIMIADPSSQRKGYGRAALVTFLSYIHTHQAAVVSEFLRSKSVSNPKSSPTSTTTPNPPESPSTTASLSLTAKISTSNTPSLSLFISLGFTKTAQEPNYFGEYELRLPLTPGGLASEIWIDGMMVRWGVGKYGELGYHE